MARNRTLAVGAVNLRVHPHPQGIYHKLIEDAYDLKKPIRIQGDRHMLISALDKREEDIVAGTLARFTEIDRELPWFDVTKLDAAEEEDLKKINIPDTMKPNYRSFFYAFFPKSHMFVFEEGGTSGNLSPNIVRRFLMGMFDQDHFKNNYGDITVDVVADADQLEQIMGLDDLKRLRIQVNRPNPDDAGSAQQKIDERLKKLGAANFEETYNAAPSKSLQPDEELTTLAKVALLNGQVEASGYDAGHWVSRSTEKHPVIEKLQYDPDALSESQAFARAARSLMGKIGGYLA